VGLNYHQKNTENGSILSQIATYAWSEDYHDLMTRMLKELGSRILSKAAEYEKVRYYVDTGAILERDLAAAGGLGWVGKNTMLIREKMGSFFFIGEIFLSLDLEYDTSVEDRCGSCTACLDACPTDAFPNAYELDARKCIAYLNIEHKGDMEAYQRSQIGDWLFGCDICQDVCPWNSKAPFHNQKDFKPKQNYSELSLQALIEISPSAFKEYFKKTPFQRLKRNGLRRNALIVAGNQKDRTCSTAVEACLEDEDEVIRETARWVVRQFSN